MQEFMNFALVLGVAVSVAASISVLYATGLRLWIAAKVDSAGTEHILTRTGSVLCFAGCVCIVLYALWLMIPLFH